jgi:hypothetical protein
MDGIENGNNSSSTAIHVGIAPWEVVARITNNNISHYQKAIAPDWDEQGNMPSPSIKNNILYLNTQTQSTRPFYGSGIVTYNCIYNNDTASYTPPSGGNIEVDPQFVNAALGDYHLKYSSPCIDAGDPNDAYTLEPEPNGGRINMGHYGNTANATGTFNIIAGSDLTKSATWSGYVIVTNNISTNGNPLTVNAGTKVFFDSAKTVTVDDEFTSQGTVNSPIIYRGYRPTDKMGGLILTGTKEPVLSYSWFNRANTALTFDEFNPENVPTFSNVLFENNTKGVYASKSSARFSASTFRLNGSGLVASESDIRISGSYFLRG